MYGRHMVLLAVQRGGVYEITRPNTGTSLFDMQVRLLQQLAPSALWLLLSPAVSPSALWSTMPVSHACTAHLMGNLSLHGQRPWLAPQAPAKGHWVCKTQAAEM